MIGNTNENYIPILLMNEKQRNYENIFMRLQQISQNKYLQ